MESKKLLSIALVVNDSLMCEMVMLQPFYIVEKLMCIHGIMKRNILVSSLSQLTPLTI